MRASYNASIPRSAIPLKHAKFKCLLVIDLPTKHGISCTHLIRIKMKILITGAFGNIGQKVIHILLDKSYQVVCFDLENKKNREVAEQFAARVNVVWGDITNEQQVCNVISDVDAVIHMAALLPAVVDRNPALGEKVNVGGTKNIISAIKQSDKQPQLIFCSSISVHGNRAPSDPYPIQVDQAFHAGDTYAGHKIACEKLIKEAGINATVVRIGACIDADSELAGSAKEMIGFLLSVNPECRFEYIHPKDVALALANAVNNPSAIGNTYFLGGGKGCQGVWKDLTEIIFGALGIRNLPATKFSKATYYTEQMDTKAAQEVLNFQVHTLQDYKNEMDEKFKLLRIVLWPFRPLIKKWICSLA
jgi:nucleoside-diphosphate-sugar epimerase